MTTEGENLELEGFAGAEIWLDPEGYTFMRLNYGSYERLREVVTNMIKVGLPSDWVKNKLSHWFIKRACSLVQTSSLMIG